MDRALYNAVLLCVLSLAVVTRAQTPATADERIFLGFLDDAREDMANWKPGVSQQRFIRLSGTEKDGK